VVALAKAANALKLSVIVTTTARDSMWGPTLVCRRLGLCCLGRVSPSDSQQYPGHGGAHLGVMPVLRLIINITRCMEVKT
jgi:hypothetical protein